MKTKKVLGMLLAVAMMGSVLAGCGSGTKQEEVAPTEATESGKDAVDTAAGKVVNKLIFGLRDSLNQEIFLECVAGLEKIYEE